MEYILVGVFAASSILGYIIIKNVPSLLHTPLMSGMNALSGVTVIGAVVAAATSSDTISLIAACFAVVLASINVSGGFFVTHRMLRMFDKKEDGNDE